MERAPAIVYVNAVLSESVESDEDRIHRQATRLGYDIVQAIRIAKGRVGGLARLAEAIGFHKAEAVFVPTIEHLEGQLDRIVRMADVIDLHGGCYARWSSIAEMADDATGIHHRAKGS